MDEAFGEGGGLHEQFTHHEVNCTVHLDIKLVVWKPHLMLSDPFYQTSCLGGSFSSLISL